MSARTAKALRGKGSANHELRTGQVGNMRSLGWSPSRRRPTVDGVPSEFYKLDPSKNEGRWLINRNRQGKYKVQHKHMAPGNRWPTVRNVVCPTFDGPVTAALWLRVEISNGVRFDS